MAPLSTPLPPARGAPLRSRHANKANLRRIVFAAVLAASLAHDDGHDRSSSTAGAATGNKKKRVAIIGGGIGGTFAAKYLAEYDTSLSTHKCLLDDIVVFDPSEELGAPVFVRSGDGDGGGGSDDEDVDDPWQGPRVSTLHLPGGKTVDLGASILYGGNRLVTAVVEADPDLIKADPFSDDAKGMPDGMGVYDGAGKFDVFTAGSSDAWVTTTMIYRYGFDLFRIRKAATKAAKAFDRVYEYLDGTDPTTFFSSPDDLWKAVGLYEPTTVSFNEYLDKIGVSKGKGGPGEDEEDVDSGSISRRVVASAFAALAESPLLPPFLRSAFLSLSRGRATSFSSLLPGREPGNLRRELLTAINLCNYNQPNGRLDGLAGLVSFLPTQGDVYKVEGGNGRILKAAFEHAKASHEGSGCLGTDGLPGAIRHVSKRVTKVVSSSGDGTMEIWSGTELLGEFDAVLLAAPLQHCRINFYVRDPSGGGGIAADLDEDDVLRPMPLAGGGNSASPLPTSATRRYTQTVTTIVSRGTLQRDHFQPPEGKGGGRLPRSIYMTERGREIEGFSSLSQLTVDGTFKVFSPEVLSDEVLKSIFGPSHRVEYVKVWGGTHGGAYPDFDGGGESTRSAPFVLYGGGDGDDETAALYYVNAAEASMAAMEISAIGAKAVAKLVSKRLGLLPGNE